MLKWWEKALFAFLVLAWITVITAFTGSAYFGVSASGNVPLGAIFAIDAGTCPSGYSELTAGQGRYLVGVPSGGTIGSTQGTALANLENRATGQHSHAFNGKFVYTWGGAGGNTGLTGGGEGFTTRTSTDNSGSVAGTNAPYLQVMFCKRTS